MDLSKMINPQSMYTPVARDNQFSKGTQVRPITAKIDDDSVSSRLINLSWFQTKQKIKPRHSTEEVDGK